MKTALLAAGLLLLCSCYHVAGAPQQYFASFQSSPVDVEDVPVNCVWCQFAVHLVQKSFLPKVKSLNQLINMTVGACDSIFHDPQNCTIIGHAIAEAVWKVKDAPPKNVCQSLNVCPKDGSTKSDYSSLMESLLKFTRKTLYGDDKLLCTLCEDTVTELKTIILKYQDLIEKEVDNLFCDHLPPDAATACRTAMANDLPNLINQYLQPEMVCQLIKLC